MGFIRYYLKEKGTMNVRIATQELLLAKIDELTNPKESILVTLGCDFS